jgi:hypothetical protein
MVYPDNFEDMRILIKNYMHFLLFNRHKIVFYSFD